MEFFKLILLISSLCLGLRIVTDEEKLFNPVREFFLQRFPELVHKPIITCVACMASFWGVIVFGYIHRETVLAHYSDKEVIVPLMIKMVVACLAASFLNAFAWSVLILIRTKIDYYLSHTKSL